MQIEEQECDYQGTEHGNGSRTSQTRQTGKVSTFMRGADSMCNISHYDNQIEDLFYHMMAHNKFCTKKKQRIQELNYMETQNGYKSPETPLIKLANRNANSSFDPIFKDLASPHTEEVIIEDKDIVCHTENPFMSITDQVEDALMTDNATLFQNLNLSLNQLIEFQYTVSGPKSHLTTERSSFVKESQEKSSYFHFNYNLIMLACHYNAVNVLEYLYSEVIMKSKSP